MDIRPTHSQLQQDGHFWLLMMTQQPCVAVPKSRQQELQSLPPMYGPSSLVLVEEPSVCPLLRSPVMVDWIPTHGPSLVEDLQIPGSQALCLLLLLVMVSVTLFIPGETPPPTQLHGLARLKYSM